MFSRGIIFERANSTNNALTNIAKENFMVVIFNLTELIETRKDEALDSNTIKANR